jgi:DNA/RNA endonuclease YhcR with UshA esterase domain
MKFLGVRVEKINLLLLVGVAVIVASCKPSGDNKSQTPAPIATNTPVVVATNTPAASTNVAIVIAPTKAREHIGEQATVIGVVSDVHVTPKGDVFLNFGGKFPNMIFTAVSFKNAIPAVQLMALKGRRISVSGKIKEYNGQVEIVLDSMEQISKQSGNDIHGR